MKTLDDQPKNPFVSWVTAANTTTKLLAFGVLGLTAVDRLSVPVAGLGHLLHSLGLALALCVVLTPYLRKRSLQFELEQVKNIPFEVLQQKTNENLEAFRKHLEEQRKAPPSAD